MSQQVRGGVGGLEVQYDELERSSHRLRGEADAVLRLALSRHRLLGDADLLASAVLAPASLARVEGALLAALDGPSGLVAAGARLELRAGQLLVAVARYRASDVLEAEQAQARRWVLLAGAATGWVVAVVARGEDPLVELERALVAHPGILDAVVESLTSVTGPLSQGLLGPLPVLADQVFEAVTGEALLPGDLAEAAGLLALLYRPGTPVWERRSDPADAAVLVPGGLGDVLARLDHRNTAARGSRAGDVGVTRIATTGADGREQVSWIVDLPGTKDWQVDPRTRSGLNDLASSLELMAGTHNARVQALERALADAGARRGQPVLLVGHSQGGMVAVRAAEALAGRLDVTHVVTAGAPVGTMTAPAGVQVLSLENRHDVVPHADGRDNADSADHVTVVFDHHGPDVRDNHGTRSAYLPAARALDSSADPSVRAWLDGADAFLAGRGEQVTATTTVYTVTNDTDGDGAVDPRR